MTGEFKLLDAERKIRPGKLYALHGSAQARTYGIRGTGAMQFRIDVYALRASSGCARPLDLVNESLIEPEMSFEKAHSCQTLVRQARVLGAGERSLKRDAGYLQKRGLLRKATMSPSAYSLGQKSKPISKKEKRFGTHQVMRNSCAQRPRCSAHRLSGLWTASASSVAETRSDGMTWLYVFLVVDRPPGGSTCHSG